jgi:hypothetical protein
VFHVSRLTLAAGGDVGDWVMSALVQKMSRFAFDLLL